MKKIYVILAALVLLPLLVSLAIIAQEPEKKNKDLPNFHKVNDNLYRGGQPMNGGLKKLAGLGIKTVVNLRGDGEEVRNEEATVNDLGMRYVSVPMSNLGRPTDGQIRQVMEIIETDANAPVFIHCRRGADRTGVVVAVYRIIHDGWTADRAIEEAKRYGMGYVQFMKRDYIKDYYEEQSNNAKQVK